ncbi:MAG TPA: helix-turn-helix transcriptional regulator [Candidatus Coproplasma excrementigallinarum]|uniref:Helix-turn-helix transcriptional regulator n=1 Tax=Candidatus Coproplasma excrementigallinarum TaxID=2840747 RepID=A0A9D1MKK3_9FIRM|nr:helix-turn-helix transcriptional regulator [Candidatus Coproplasma excrementigallinarum]
MYGERLRELRKAEGLTQKQLAEKLNISQKSLSKYECERLDLNTELIIKICKLFQVSADYLLGLGDY